jgi:hypothetical protein
LLLLYWVQAPSTAAETAAMSRARIMSILFQGEAIAGLDMAVLEVIRQSNAVTMPGEMARVAAVRGRH